jgi:shikimate dehydrogenase
LRRLAVLGQPVGHSLSPAIHNAAFSALGMGGEWRYEAIEVAPDEFEARVLSMPAEGFAGANVTVPHKSAALAVADEISEVVRETGAANTLAFKDDSVHAYNTDAGGFLAALPESPEGKRALVLGAGGAARAVVWTLVRQGAEVSVWNRTPLRSEHLAEDLGGRPVDEPEPGGCDLVVNSTTVGLGSEDPFAELPLSPEDFGPGQTVVDLVYGRGPSRLLAAAAAAGAATVDGIEVLVRQGAVSFRIWTGREPSLEAMREAARSA